MSSARPEASTPPTGALGLHLAEDSLGVDGVDGLLGGRRHGERGQKRVDENADQLVHRSSDWPKQVLFVRMLSEGCILMISL